MENTSCEPHTGTIASHFSHPHPLKLIVYKQTLNLTSPCSGCKLKPSGMLYSCTICNYYLHKNCFEMPHKMTHPFHNKHALTLLPKPAYGDRNFICDACGEKGKGFTYHCEPCGIDLHMLCAIMPLSFTCEFHMHKLNLTFQHPDKKFLCAICHTPGSSHYWLYRCKPCGFDAHLNCARPHVPPLPRQQNIMPKPKPMMNNVPYGFPAGIPVQPPFEVNRENKDVSLRVVLQVVSNNQVMAQAVLPAGSSFTGGSVDSGGRGTVGGNMGLHQLMHLISSLDNNDGIGSGSVPCMDANCGNSGGDGIPGLHALGGGTNSGGVGITGLDAFSGGGGDQDFQHKDIQQSNDPRLFQIRTSLATLSQSDQSIGDYYTRVKSLWDELSTFHPGCSCGNCNCIGIQSLDSYFKAECVMNFLMGLKDSFHAIRHKILVMDPLPPISRVLSLLVEEENQHTLSASHSTPGNLLPMATRDLQGEREIIGKINTKPNKETPAMSTTHFGDLYPLNNLVTDHQQTIINSSASHCTPGNLLPIATRDIQGEREIIGNINIEHNEETSALSTHFSHPHPLNKLITNHQLTLIKSSSSCSGCNRKPSGTIYSCKTCNFFLHKKCFEMPKKKTHPFHKEHALTLLPEPAYAAGFICDACNEMGMGFSYNCEPCGIDLHMLCATMPLSLTSISHEHDLDLTFESPYPPKTFSCDVCKTLGKDPWLYRCAPCGFDAHLNCPVKQNQTNPIPRQTVRSWSTPAPRPQVLGPRPSSELQHHFGPNHGTTPTPRPQVLGPRPSGEVQHHNGPNDGMANPAFRYPIVGGVSSSRVDVQNNMLLHAPKLISMLNHIGGSGNIPILDAFGDGGVSNSVSSLLGGGTGLDFLGGFDF